MKKISDEERIEITESALHVLLKGFEQHFQVKRADLKSPYDSRPVLIIAGNVNAYWMRSLLEHFVVEYVYLDCTEKFCRSLVITSLRDLSKFKDVFCSIDEI